jgi:hypothetical protein
MKIKAVPSLNLDLLNLVNIMTGDRLYFEHHRDVCGRFNSVLSPTVKGQVKGLANKRQTTFLSEAAAFLVSALPDFNTRDLCDLLLNHREIRDTLLDAATEEGHLGTGHSPAHGPLNPDKHKFTKEELIGHLTDIWDVIVPFIKELKRVGVVGYWEYRKYPLLNSRSRALNDFLNSEDTGDVENVYVCAFAAPHEIKLFGNNIMIDYRLNDEAALKAVKRVVSD